MSYAFELDPRLARETVPLLTLDLCRALLRNDRRFPWIVLVPLKPGAVEITDLDREQQGQLLRETVLAAEIIRSLPAVEKLNIACLGNVVAQLHVHVVGRSHDDACWPAPPFGNGEPEPYERSELIALTDQFRRAFERAWR